MRHPAANRDIWKASGLQRLFAERGLVISAGKMSQLWSGQQVSLKLDDLDIVCAVPGRPIGELLIPEPDKVPDLCATRPPRPPRGAVVGSAPRPMRVVPRRRDGRSLPPA